MGAGTMQRSGGRRGRRRGKSAAMSEINVTPFVDVMLVLMIIFMVAAPMLTVGVPIELPKTAATALPTEQEEPLTVEMGVVWVGEDPSPVVSGFVSVARKADRFRFDDEN